MSLSREERNNYEFRLKAILDERSAISYATKKGKIEEKLEIAKKMLKRNMDIKEIQELTGLSKEEIENIN